MTTQERAEQIARELKKKGNWQVVVTGNTAANFPAQALLYLKDKEPKLCKQLFDSLENNTMKVAGQEIVCKMYTDKVVKLPRFMLEKSVYDEIPDEEKKRWVGSVPFSINESDFYVTNQWNGHLSEATNNQRINDFAYLVYEFFVGQCKYFVNFNNKNIELCCLQINNNIESNVRLSLQQIFYGAPGTGKSNTIKREVEDQGIAHFRTTFHPDSDYSTFVGCYKPTMKSVKKTVVIGQDEKAVKPLEGYSDSVEQISYSFVPQAFAKAYCEAWNKYDSSENAEPVFLIIEEINRGNCAQIFGDIFQLLDREMEGARCGFSTYPIDADEDLKAFLEDGTKKDGSQWLTNKEGIKDGKLCLPPNLHIWATMNTSDQSLFPIDSAFKRRWDWKYMPIDTKKENWTIKTASNEYSWSSFLEKINEEIDSTTHSEDKMLGFYFCRANSGVIDADKFVSKVLFYIYNDVFKDYGFDREMFKDGDGKVMSFKSYYKADGSVDESKVERFLDNLTKDKE